MDTTDLQSILAHAYGYVYVTVAGQIFVFNICTPLYDQLGLAKRPHARHSRVLGVVECFLFLSALQLGKPEFIAFWLTLKTAAQWKHWTEVIPKGTAGAKQDVLGRNGFNVFLLGNGLIIAFAVVGSKLIEWINTSHFSAAVTASIGVVVSATCLTLFAQRPEKWQDFIILRPRKKID